MAIRTACANWLTCFTSRRTQQLKQIEDAVRANKSAEVGHVAHSCKGASATLGMTRLAAVLLKLEKLGKSGALAGAEELCAEAPARIQGHPGFSRGASRPRRDAADREFS